MRISDWSSDVCSSDLCEALVLQHWALLDVQLHEGGDAARPARTAAHFRRIEAEGPVGLAHADALLVFRLQHGRVEGAGDGAAAGPRGSDAGAFQIGRAACRGRGWPDV